MKPKIVVIGSANTDMIVKVGHLPCPGETVLGDHFIQSRGGKGGNQAVAAARLGAEVSFIGRLGRDSFGQNIFEAFEKEGINTGYILWDDDAPTGIALIMINKEGENIICVSSGANGKLSEDDIIKSADVIKSADCMLLQLEVPVKTVEFAIRFASKYHVRVVLNPAPIARLSKEVMKLVDVLTPNKTEALALFGKHEVSPRELAYSLKMKYALKNVIVTLGKDGAVVSKQNEPSPIHIASFPVESVDATGAGDAFNGGLAVALATGYPLDNAVAYANAVGALATTRLGAQSSLPTARQVKNFLKRITGNIAGIGNVGVCEKR